MLSCFNAMSLPADPKTAFEVLQSVSPFSRTGATPPHRGFKGFSAKKQSEFVGTGAVECRGLKPQAPWSASMEAKHRSGRRTLYIYATPLRYLGFRVCAHVLLKRAYVQAANMN